MDSSAAGGLGAGIDQLPIDISYAKLGDWLVDRKKLPADWRKKLVPIQARILAALSTLSSSADPWLRTLTSDSTGYLEAKRARELLVEGNPDARGLFGRLSGAAGEWDAVVRAYEKDLLYLGESAQIMVQNINYEIPYYKKQIAKLQQQTADLDHKEAEFKRNAAASALKYQQACQELGIAGINVRAELLGLVRTLPKLFAEITDAICTVKIGQALDCYQAFVNYAHTEPQGQPKAVLATLRELRENPESVVLNDPVQTGRSAEPIYGSLDVLPVVNATESETTIIDWDVNEGTADGQAEEINWDVVPSEFEIGEPIAEVVDDRSVLTEGAIDETQDTGEICWDIDVEDAADAGASVESLTSTGEDTSQVVEGNFSVKSSLVDIEYRNRLLNDLFELKAFLKQRLEEMHSDETAALQDQVRAVAPPDVQQHGSDSIRDIVQSVTGILDLLMNEKTRSLIMILTSSRFLDRLEASLNQKKQTETKLSQSLAEFGRKRLELRNTLSALWPKQEAAMTRTREVKKFVESVLSSQYGGRRVNIIGEINTVLGYA